jgi:hypothetical protein
MRPGPTPLAQTVSELEDICRGRHWRIRTPTWNPGHDNVHVLAQAEDGTWRVGYRERCQDDWWDKAFTEQEAVAYVHRALLRHSAPHELVEPDLSCAVVAYLHRGRADRPQRDPDAVPSAELLTRVEALVAETLEIEPVWPPEVGDPVEIVLSAMHGRHPELDERALEALGWLYTYDWT